jgi:hypothetical protein
MTHQFQHFNTDRLINATEKDELVDKIGFLGNVAPPESTSIKVSAFLRHSKLYGLGLLLDGIPHSWSDPYLKRHFQRHTAHIYTPGMDVSYRVDEKIQRVNNMAGLPPHWHMPRVKLESSYLHSFKVCYPNSIQTRRQWLEQQQARDEVDEEAMEELFNVLLPVEPGEH